MRPIAEVVVTIPARDEESLIGRCLESILAARELVHMPVHVIVVADGCLDATAAVARRYDGVRVVEIDSSNVGTARATAAQAALALVTSAPDEVWMANTDADSVVPSNWLSEQVRLAESGADVMIGTVRPDFDDLTEGQVRAWRATHVRGEPNGHVHGANLGMSAAAYVDAGGVPPLALAEDQALVDALRVRARRLVATGRIPVSTSGRRESRTTGGFADHLRELG